MEEQWLDDVWTWYESNCEFLGLAIGAAGGMLGTLIFGLGYKQRIKSLEAKGTAPTINVNITHPIMWPTVPGDQTPLTIPDPDKGDPKE